MARIPMASVDAAWLGMEDPTNLMMVTGVMVLDGPLDMKRMRLVLERRLAPFGRRRHRARASAARPDGRDRAVEGAGAPQPAAQGRIEFFARLAAGCVPPRPGGRPAARRATRPHARCGAPRRARRLPPRAAG